jgi:hypothetical protein
MKTSLSIGFDDSRFTTEYIKIEDVPIVPIEGKGVRFKWSDFMNDKELCQRLEDFEDDDLFFANIVTIEYTKAEVIVHISLMEHRDYIRHYGNHKMGSKLLL